MMKVEDPFMKAKKIFAGAAALTLAQVLQQWA